MQERSVLSAKIDSIQKAEEILQSTAELLNLAEGESDNYQNEIISEILDNLKKIDAELAEEKITLMFSGEADDKSCFLEIHSGAGGTESDDWAAMLLRMYTRWAEKHKYKVTVVDILNGEEAGIKGVTIKIDGLNAYGWLRTESGIHRLVRISPFSSTGKRHTSFASVWVFPVIDDSIKIEINESDLKIDTYRSSGAGGQHVNTTDSAVRITHLPTKIVVQSQSQRSQHKNKDECMSMLRARLYEFELQKKKQALEAQNALKTDIGWGNQIRSYVLQPYQMVKDLRTDHSISNAAEVLDGSIDEFIVKSLEMKI